MPKRSPQVSDLEAILKQLAKAKPQRALELLDEAFKIFAAAGQRERAASIVRLAYSLPLPKEHYHAFGTGPFDGFCAIAKLGDVTHGEPLAPHLSRGMSLAERVQASERLVRDRLTSAEGERTPKAKWTTLSGRPLLLAVKALARPGKNGAPPKTESEALAAMTRYMDAWCNDPEDRGAGYGEEVALSLDLALGQGDEASVRRWVLLLGPHMLEWGIAEALCLPRVAKAIVEGLLAPIVQLPAVDAKRIHQGIEKAVGTLANAAKDVKPARTMKAGDKPSRRTIHAEYSQFYLEHAKRPNDEIYFEDKRESAQGMSIFRTHVAIGTPTDTGDCVVELALAKGKPASLAIATQAVAFPFVVSGPLFVRTATGGDDECDEVMLPHGAYDVLVRFLPKRAARDDENAGLRAFRIAVDFHPKGTLNAPRCLKLEVGKPPKEVIIH